MSRTNVVADARTYRVSLDENARGPLATWAVVSARAVDELTGAPPSAPVWVRVAEAGLLPQIGQNGLFGLLSVGPPRFPLSLAPGFALHVSVGAERYLARRLTVPITRALVANALSGALILSLDSRWGMTVGQRWVLGNPASVHEVVTIAALGPGATDVTLTSGITSAYLAPGALAPDALTSIELGDVELHRMPVSLRGRVMAWVPLAHAFQPVAGADVEVPWLWRRQSQVTHDSAKEALNLVSISPGLYRDRVAAVDLLQPESLAPVPGEAKNLLADAEAGALELSFSNALGVSLGSLQRVDSEQPEVSEVLNVAAVSPSGTLPEPARVALHTATLLAHRRGVKVEHVTTAPTLVAKGVHSDGIAGDPVVFLTDLAWATSPTFARIGGGSPDERQRLQLFQTKTDSDGYFSLPPLSRVAQVRVLVTPPALPAQNFDLQPDYRAADQWLDIRFS